MEKKVIFISHINEEKLHASVLKEMIEEAFLGLVDVFVSSENESVMAGSKWVDHISGNLKRCDIGIILSSPNSVNRPWINFEAGAFWVRDIPAIPLCHSGMNPPKLPIPLNLLQAKMLHNENDIKDIIKLISKNIGSRNPNVDLSKFIAKLPNDFDEDSLYFSEFCEKLNKLDATLLKELQKNEGVYKTTISQRIYDNIRNLIDEYRSRIGYIVSEFRFDVETTLMYPGEVYYELEIKSGSEFLDRIKTIDY